MLTTRDLSMAKKGNLTVYTRGETSYIYQREFPADAQINDLPSITCALVLAH